MFIAYVMVTLVAAALNGYAAYVDFAGAKWSLIDLASVLLQVKLARHEYMLPRLAGLWEHLDKERGGIGLRGSGEKQIEIDRRARKGRRFRVRG